MKKFIRYIILVISLLALFISSVQAGKEGGENTGAGITAIEVEVTEVAPFMSNCTKNTDDSFYTCSVKPGIDSILMMGGQFVKWATFIVLLLGVLFVVVYGILYSMSGLDESMKGEAKGRIQKATAGVILLLLSGLILNTLFPRIYQL